MFIGRLELVKGLDILINAIAYLKEKNNLYFKLCVIGEGSLENELKSYVSQKELSEFFVFIGKIPHNKINNWMSAADLICLPSYNEGYPNVLLESIACGTPVIASNTGGIPDIVNSNNGILFKTGDFKELAYKLKAGLDMKWDANKVKDSVQQLSWTSIAQKYIKVFNQTVNVNGIKEY